MTQNDSHPRIEKSDSWRMFNEISPRYDLLNRILSLGLDLHWRKKLSAFIPQTPNQRVLDLATGTGDVLISLFDYQHIFSGVGLDLAEEMLKIAQKKIEQKGLSEKIVLQKGDIQSIPFRDQSFDLTTTAFGIRNVSNPPLALTEMHRVLKTGGRSLILEFSLPQSSVLRAIHLFYLRRVVPIVGGWLSGNTQAYRYLNQTIETFPYGQKFCQMMQAAGFKNSQAHTLLWGTATIYQGDK